VRVLDVVQGSDEWHAARLGVVTASAISRIVTPKALKPSAQAEKYMHELLAEWALREQVGGVEPTGYMTRGVEQEDLAARHYAWTHDVEVEVAGFFLRDDGLVGCSPDRLVGSDGLLEIKVPSATGHVANMLGGADAVAADYRIQLQSQLWVCERDWVDIFSFNTELPSAEQRVARDEAAIEAISNAVDSFVSKMLAARARMVALGVAPDR
jgi:hypothetical protein